MCRISAPKWQRGASMQMKFKIFRAMEGSSKENLHREEGDVEFGPADVNGSDGDYPNESSVEEVNESSRSTSRSRGCCRVRKMRSGSGGGGGGRGEDNNQKVPLKNTHTHTHTHTYIYGSHIFMLLVLVCDSVECCNPENGEVGS